MNGIWILGLSILVFEELMTSSTAKFSPRLIVKSGNLRDELAAPPRTVSNTTMNAESSQIQSEVPS
jgi:hypothetical protein